jgi:hypothetical protein
MTRATDADFLARVLADGAWHTLDEILAESFRERGCGMTVHSRAATLRKRGWTVEQRSRRTDAGRVVSSYRGFWPLEEAAPAPGGDVGAASSNTPEPLALFAAPRGAYDGEAAA